MASRPATSTIDALVVLSFSTHARIETRAARDGMSVTQMRLLGILRDREPTVGELTRRLALSKSSVSGLIDRAVQRGLVTRTQDPDDGRTIRVRLAPTGRTLIDTAASKLEDDLHDVLAALTPAEQETWGALTEKLLAAEIADRGALGL